MTRTHEKMGERERNASAKKRGEREQGTMRSGEKRKERRRIKDTQKTKCRTGGECRGGSGFTTGPASEAPEEGAECVERPRERLKNLATEKGSKRPSA